MSSIYIRTGKETTFTNHHYDDVRDALKNLEGDIKIRRRNGERWDKISKYKYVREDGLVMEITGVSW